MTQITKAQLDRLEGEVFVAIILASPVNQDWGKMHNDSCHHVARWMKACEITVAESDPSAPIPEPIKKLIS
jgi:hypothetical protein